MNRIKTNVKTNLSIFNIFFTVIRADEATNKASSVSDINSNIYSDINKVCRTKFFLDRALLFL